MKAQYDAKMIEAEIAHLSTLRDRALIAVRDEAKPKEVRDYHEGKAIAYSTGISSLTRLLNASQKVAA
ncbi:hypothetical protein [Roseimicrobium sp. ORNL1]|uniref:hypothetical protein n=1 Tax=Roseimicrobium sp. ORNL1 TaxID=2711231 RepID=UPI0013E1B906|nr:hypothetical protein [Roseimicrobium sp. ORNL1]QIF02781.1 hypothetical protein G5S37_15045 [Roseimicrobium sp. ORNL1]